MTSYVVFRQFSKLDHYKNGSFEREAAFEHWKWRLNILVVIASVINLLSLRAREKIEKASESYQAEISLSVRQEGPGVDEPNALLMMA